MHAMLRAADGGNSILLREMCGFEHESQIVALPRLAGIAGCGMLLDTVSGEKIPCQQSKENPEILFALLALHPRQERNLVASDAPFACDAPAALEGNVLQNSRCALRIAPGGPLAERYPAGPILGIRGAEGTFFGMTRFDCDLPPVKMERSVLEAGPLRNVVEFRALNPAGKTIHTLRLTLDAQQCFAEIDEISDGRDGDQLLWIFPAATTGYLLDTSASYRTILLDYGIDNQVARLGCWSQFSQLNLSDGFAFKHNETVCGAVTLRGGEWHGNRQNQLSMVLRRIRNMELSTRLGVPPAIKADSIPPNPAERTTGRDHSATEPFLFLEGEIGKGRRVWGLVLTTPEEFRPAAGDDTSWSDELPTPLSHFELSCNVERFRAQQGLLRRLFIQRGLLPLQDQLSLVFDWEEEDFAALPPLREAADGEFAQLILRSAQLGVESQVLREQMADYLRCRCDIFWYGAGSISTNAVVARQVAPFALLFAEQCRRGIVPEDVRRTLRARFALLAEIMHTPNYYPGESAMTPGSDPESLDPGMRGMANQNFYTDVINLPATVGAAFPGHPRAERWRQTFVAHFGQQLDTHVYNASGVWEESHTYFQHVLATVGMLLSILKQRGEADFFADARFRKLLSCAVAQRTVRDRRFGFCRYILPFGDHGADPENYRRLWAFFSREMQATDPALAAELAWFAREYGSSAPLSVEPVPPKLRSEHLAGLGIFFRGHDTKLGESLFALRTGSAWGHHHNDDGSFWLFGAERMLIGDGGEGSVNAGGWKFCDLGHSRRTVSGGGILNYHWRFHRGYPTCVKLGAHIEYATMFSPCSMRLIAEQNLPLQQPFLLFRTVIKLAPNRYLLLDSTPQPVATETNFHLGGERTECVRNGAIVAHFSDLQLRLTPLKPLVPEPMGTIEGERGGTPTHRWRYRHAERKNYAAYFIEFDTAPTEPAIRIAEDSYHLRTGALALQLTADPTGFLLEVDGVQLPRIAHTLVT